MYLIICLEEESSIKRLLSSLKMDYLLVYRNFLCFTVGLHNVNSFMK